MLFVLDIMQVTFVRAYCGFANNRFQLSGYGHANKNEQCSEAHAYLSSSFRYLGNKWEGPRTLLGLRGKAIHA